MNAGALALAKALTDRGDKAELARELAVLPSQVSRWLTGGLIPKPPLRARLQELHGIDWRLWDQDVKGAAKARGDQ